MARSVLLLLGLLASSASAFAPPKTALAPRPVAPRPAALDKALVLRGGITKETFITTVVIANAMFGLQFLLIPKMFFDQVNREPCLARTFE